MMKSRSITRSLAISVLPLVFAAMAYAEPQPLEINGDHLVETAVVGYVAPPVLRDPPYRISPEGA